MGSFAGPTVLSKESCGVGVGVGVVAPSDQKKQLFRLISLP
jgi:hypothetical protein